MCLRELVEINDMLTYVCFLIVMRDSQLVCLFIYLFLFFFDLN